MIVTRYRQHKVNTGQGTYESLDFGASASWDTTVDGEAEEEDIGIALEEVLDAVLDKPVDRALRLPGIIQESHIWDYYDRG